MTPKLTLEQELSLTKGALDRASTALAQATARYLSTFPEEIRQGLPSYATSKSNASAAYYMYASALSYIIEAIETTVAGLASLGERALKEDNSSILERCRSFAEEYEEFSRSAMSPYFEGSQRLIQGNGETISLSALYSVTCEFLRRSEALAKLWKA